MYVVFFVKILDFRTEITSIDLKIREEYLY